MAYKLTPEQYKDAAKRRIENPNTAENTNSAVSAYAKALDASRALDNKNVNATEIQQPTQNYQSVEPDETQTSNDWMVRTLSTVAAPVIRFSEGIAKFLENGLLDAGAGIVATALDIFGADDAAKNVQSWAAQDLVGEAVLNWDAVQDIYNNSWSNEWKGFGELLQESIYSVGAQAIPFALNFIPGIGPAASQIAFAAGAYGGGFESASQDGGDVLGASAYGALSAGLEMLVENIGGAFGWGKTITDGLDNVIAKVAKNENVRKLLKGIVDVTGEGVEEVISGALDNYIKALTYKGDYSSLEAYFNNIVTTDKATQEELLEQFVVGALSGGLMGGASSIVRRVSPTMQMSETIQEVEELREKGIRLNERGKDTLNNENEIIAKENRLVETVNKNLEKLTARSEQGNKTAKSFLEYMQSNFNTDENGNFTTSKNALVKNENVSYGVTESDVEKAVVSRGNTLHAGALEGNAAQAKTNVENALRNINKGLKNNRLNLVVADIKQADGERVYGYLQGNTVVIDANSFGEDMTFKVTENGKTTEYKADAGMSTLLHEVLHFTDNTKAGQELQRFLSMYAVEKNGDIVSEVATAYEGKSVNEQISEVSARQLEELLFNEEVIKRLMEDNTTLAKRILNKAERILKALKGEKIVETKSLEKLLDKTVKLYNKAILESGKGKTFDKDGKVEYSKRTTKYIPYSKIGEDNIRVINQTLYKLYDGVESAIADEIAIENGNTIFVVDSGKENGKIDFGVRKRINISDNTLRIERTVKINDRAISKGFVSSEIFGRIRSSSNQYRGGGVGRQVREELSSNTGKSSNIKEGISEEVRYSRRITDSDGVVLTEEQIEYFKNSKVRDENGNLLVVYHGTRKADFTEFKRNINFFTDNKEMADSYAPSGEQFVGYLNIINPFVIDARGEKWSRVPIDKETKSLLEKYGASVFKENGKWRTSPADIASAIESGIDDGELDYDGIIIKNIDDTGRYWKTRDNIVANDYITFESNQFKNADNKQPTESPDIRYSRRIVSNEDVKKSVDDALQMLTIAGEIDESNYDVRINAGKILANRIARINDIALKGKLSEDSKVIKELATAIFDNAILEQIDETGEIAEAALTAETLRAYLHTMNLSTDSIKPEIKNQYGEQNNIFRIWGKKNGGSAWDSVVQEIVEVMPSIKKDSDIETLFNIFDTYAKSIEVLDQSRKKAHTLIKNADEIKRLMAKQIAMSLSDSGTELVEKATADKLQSILIAERESIRETLLAVKNNEKQITFNGKDISKTVKKQLESILETIAKERANVQAENVLNSIIRKDNKGLSDSALAKVQKTAEYAELKEYIAEQYLSDDNVSMKYVRETNAASVLKLQYAIESIKRLQRTLQGASKALSNLRTKDFSRLQEQLRNFAKDNKQIEAFKAVQIAKEALFKVASDGSHRLITPDQMLSTGALSEFVKAFNEYFNNENPVLVYMVQDGSFDQMSAWIKDFENYVKGLSGYNDLTIEQQTEFAKNLAYFMGIVHQATKAVRTVQTKNGEVPIKQYADKSMRTLEAGIRRNADGNVIRRNKFFAVAFKYLSSIVRPRVAIQMIEQMQYAGDRIAGGLTGAFDMLRAGLVKGRNKSIDLERIISDFYNDKRNKVNGRKYNTYLKKETATLKHSTGEITVSKAKAISLYMTLVQEDGFRHADANNPMSQGIYIKGEGATRYENDKPLKFTLENVNELFESFNETDRKFIEKLKEFFYEGGLAKGEVDTYFYGMPRLLGEDYYPLRIDSAQKDTITGDKLTVWNPLDPVGHLSINQSRTNGQKALIVEGVLDVVRSYSNSVGMYYGLAVPLADFRTIYTAKTVNGDSLKSYIAHNVYSGFDEYIDTLLKDIQGARTNPDGILELLRSHFARFQIAANIKTAVVQLSAFFTLPAELKWASVAYGMARFGKKFDKTSMEQMYKYCPATRARFVDNQAVLAQANVSQLDKATEVLTKHIEAVDKTTVYVAWEAAKKEVGAIGQNENNELLLEKAGALLDKVLNSLDRYEMSERTALSRSQSIFLRSFAMFSSSQQGQLSLLVEKIATHRQRIYEKNNLPKLIEIAQDKLKASEEKVSELETKLQEAKSNGDKTTAKAIRSKLRQAKEIESNDKLNVNELIDRKANIEKELKSAGIYAKKAVSAVTVSIVAASALNTLMSNLLNDEEEKDAEETAKDISDEVISSMLSLLPGFGQTYNALSYGVLGKKSNYDVSIWAIDEWNDIVRAVDSIASVMSGEGTTTPARAVRDALYAVGQLLGVPARNMYKLVNLALNFSPKTKYEFNNLFGTANYGADLKKAVDAGDTELADTIVKLMLKDENDEPDTKVVQTIRSLYEQEYTNVIPKTVRDSITVDGTTYNMTSAQQKAFKRIYSQADTTVENLIGKKSFSNLSAKAQADSIKWIYDYYYEKAKENLTGIEDDSKKALFGEYLSIETLAIAYGSARALEADKDKEGNSIIGTKKPKVVKYLNSLNISAAEKYMLLGYLGYSPVNTNAKNLITTYARRNGADKKTINELLEACNIAV